MTERLAFDQGEIVAEVDTQQSLLAYQDLESAITDLEPFMTRDEAGVHRFNAGYALRVVFKRRVDVSSNDENQNVYNLPVEHSDRFIANSFRLWIPGRMTQFEGEELYFRINFYQDAKGEDVWFETEELGVHDIEHWELVTLSVPELKPELEPEPLPPVDAQTSLGGFINFFERFGDLFDAKKSDKEIFKVKEGEVLRITFNAPMASKRTYLPSEERKDVRLTTIDALCMIIIYPFEHPQGKFVISFDNQRLDTEDVFFDTVECTFADIENIERVEI